MVSNGCYSIEYSKAMSDEYFNITVDRSDEHFSINNVTVTSYDWL